jgi:hypothetical protein
MGRRVRVAHRSESEQDFRFFLPRAGAHPQSARFIELATYVMRRLLLACASNLPGRIKFHSRGNVCNL